MLMVLSLKTDVNLPTVRNKHKKNLQQSSFFVGISKTTAQKEQDPDPELDPDP
jgi:hypothetical protein